MIYLKLLYFCIIDVGYSKLFRKNDIGEHTYSAAKPDPQILNGSVQTKDLNLNSPEFHLFTLQNDSVKQDSTHGSSFLDRGAALALQLRQIANTELGVTKLQNEFNSLSYVKDISDEEGILSKMVFSLEEKVKLHRKLVEDMSNIIKSCYMNFTKRKLKASGMSSSSLIINFAEEGQVLEKHQEYYPCCVIPDHYLIFNPHFGTKVNTELWCDTGIREDNSETQNDMFFTPTKLTNLFSLNHHLHPNLKWQFFMSANGVHTEFPAHRSGTSVGSDCGQSSRHHQIFEKTIRPEGRNIVIFYDLGPALRARLLLTAKAIGHYLVDTMTEKDNVAVLGVSNTVIYPSPPCMASRLVSATQDIKSSLRNFIDNLEFYDVPTNYTLGFEKALQMIKNWPAANRLKGGSSTKVLVTFITSGHLGDLKEVQNVMEILFHGISSLQAQVAISAFGLNITLKEPSIQSLLLDTVVQQDYSKYGMKMKKSVFAGEIIEVPSTLRVAAIIKDFYNVFGKPKDPIIKTDSEIHGNVTISDIYWDEQGNGMVVTFSKAVYDENKDLIGVVGVDTALAYLLESSTYFTSPDGSYSMIMDNQGNILDHPKMGRPRLLNSPLIPTQATLLETSSTFLHLAPHMIGLSSGHKRSRKSSNEQVEQREYWWQKSPSFDWVFIISKDVNRHQGRKLSATNPSLPPESLFHRLDLLSPQEAKVCRHFNQMATLDGAAIFLSLSCYSSPSTYLATSFRNLNVDINMMAYLMDGSNLIVNHGLNEKTKSEAGALHLIANNWKELSKSSNLQKYIVRRYGATLGGVTLIYPGTLLDASYDPTAQGWFIKAIERPGEVVVSPPFLDPGGAGYVVTVSHTVYQGLSAALHSPLDPIMAVLAADFTLGFWHKLLSDIEPACANSFFFNGVNADDRNRNFNIRCFIMDTSGYLIGHPSFIDPFSLHDTGHNHPRHITHQEPALSMSLLGKWRSSANMYSHPPILKKIWCSKQWKGASERYYSVDLSVGKLISNYITTKGQVKNERSCLQYKLTAVPASNLILGFINQTCSPPTAFCPCSMVDRPCLNCQFMENTACECPCECALPSQPCSGLPFISLTSFIGHQDSLTSNISDYNNNHSTKIFKEEIKEWLGAPISCPRTAENPAPLHYGVGLLSQLSVCMPVSCDIYSSIHSCLGVLDCVWCVLENDGQTLLDTPFCSQSYKCFGGIRGSSSPYPPGLAPLPHSEDRASSLPVVPVIGGVIVIFLILGVAIYAYRTYAGVSPNRNAYTPSSFQSQTRHSHLYPVNVCQDLESVENNLLDDRIISAEAAAAISPYRMNPTYRRPPNAQGEASDNGYSTMTPHEESDNLTYTDLVTSAFFPSSSLNDNDKRPSISWSDTNNHTEMFSHIAYTLNGNAGGCNHTSLSSPKRIGPNKLIVPVTVHMVDSV